MIQGQEEKGGLLSLQNRPRFSLNGFGQMGVEFMDVGSIFPEGQWCAQQDAAGKIGRKDLGGQSQGTTLLEDLLCFESRAVQSDLPADPEHLWSSMGRQADTIKVSNNSATFWGTQEKQLEEV